MVITEQFNNLLSLPSVMGSPNVCRNRGYHDWDINYYEDYHMICFQASCNTCGAEAESGEIGVELNE
jgi:hypothetical protein